MELNPTYKLFCSMMCDIMDKDFDKSLDKFGASWQFLAHIPDSAWKPMVAIASDKWEGWPRNWVKSVKEAYELWRSTSHHSSIKFNRDYDDRYPVENMHQAYDILLESGQKAFIQFCEDTGMPMADRDRVVMKYRVIRGEVKIDTDEIKRKIGSMGKGRVITYTPERMAQLQAQKVELLKQAEYSDEVPF